MQTVLTPIIGLLLALTASMVAFPAHAESRTFPAAPDCVWDNITNILNCDTYIFPAGLVDTRLEYRTSFPDFTPPAPDSAQATQVCGSDNATPCTFDPPAFDFNSTCTAANQVFRVSRISVLPYGTKGSIEGAQFAFDVNDVPPAVCDGTPVPPHDPQGNGTPENFSINFVAPSNGQTVEIDDLDDFIFRMRTTVDSVVHAGESVTWQFLFTDDEGDPFCSNEGVGVANVGDITLYEGSLEGQTCVTGLGTYGVKTSAEFAGGAIENSEIYTFFVVSDTASLPDTGDIVDDVFLGGGVAGGGGGSWGSEDPSTCVDNPFDEPTGGVLDSIGNFIFIMGRAVFAALLGVDCTTLKPLIDLRSDMAGRAPFRQVFALVGSFNSAVENSEAQSAAISIPFPFFGDPNADFEIFDPVKVYQNFGGDNGWGATARPIFITGYYLGMAFFFASELKKLFATAA